MSFVEISQTPYEFCFQTWYVRQPLEITPLLKTPFPPSNWFPLSLNFYFIVLSLIIHLLYLDFLFAPFSPEILTLSWYSIYHICLYKYTLCSNTLDFTTKLSHTTSSSTSDPIVETNFLFQVGRPTLASTLLNTVFTRAPKLATRSTYSPTGERCRGFYMSQSSWERGQSVSLSV